MTIELVEHGPHWDLPRLSAAQANALRALVKVSDQPPSRSRLRPDGRVGMVRAGDVTVYVEPKMPITQLLFLIDFATKPVRWRDPATAVAEGGDLCATVADLYSRLAERTLSRGVLRGYRPVDATLPVVRGRLRLTDQMAARSGLPLPLEVRYSELTDDIPENRILRTAATAALSLPRLRPDTVTRLNRVTRLLAGAVAIPTGEPPRWQATRLNVAYHQTLPMAEVILHGSAFRLSAGPVPALGLVLDMARIYEQFLCRALGEAMEDRLEGRSESQFSTPLDEGTALSIIPDFVFLVDGFPRAVADAKYKFGQRQLPTDTYQMIVYCTGLGLSRGHLVYAEGPAGPTEHAIRNSAIRVVRHALDLTLAPEELLAAVGRLADDLAADCSAATLPGFRRSPAGGSA